MRTNDEIINLLTEIRKEKNMSISEIARQVGMAKSAVSRYFNKTREFPLNRADQFAKVLGISPEYLLGVNANNQEKQENIDLLEEALIKTFRKLDDSNKRKVVDYANHALADQNDEPNKKGTKEELDVENRKK